MNKNIKDKNSAYISLTDDKYIIGTEVLIRSLKKVKSKYKLIILYKKLKRC